MQKYRTYIQWSRSPELTGTKTSHISFISFNIFKLIPLDILPLRQPCSGCWHFLEGQYFTPSKARYFGQITMFSPFSSNKPTRASISSLSEATHDCVVYNPLKWVFTSLTQEFKGKNCVRSGYLVDTSHALVQCTAKEHENCDVASNQRSFHLCIVCFQPIGAQHFEILSMHVHAFSSSTVRVVKWGSRSRFTENKTVPSRFTKNKIGILRFTEKKENVFLQTKVTYRYILKNYVQSKAL